MKQASNGAEPRSSGIDEPDEDIRPATSEMRRRGLFGRRVRLLRERLGLSGEEFSARYDFSAIDLTDWERGRTMPSAEAVERISEIEANPDLRPTMLRA